MSLSFLSDFPRNFCPDSVGCGIVYRSWVWNDRAGHCNANRVERINQRLGRARSLRQRPSRDPDDAGSSGSGT